MSLTLMIPEQTELSPRITVFGVGGAGGNAVNNMIEQALDGVDFVAANTDAQALQQSKATRRIQLGTTVTQGLGAGAKPQVGCSAAEESIEEIVESLHGAHMCFITAGMGGGTGTGAAPVIARAAREMGVLTVGVVTKPFHFEGARRMRFAEAGIEELQRVVDTLIIIPNQNLFRLANERTTFAEAFMMADDVLYQGVKGVTDLMVRPGLINLDFADVRSVMDEMGKAMMGTGEAAGDDRAVQAAEKAIANPLLDEISLKGARGVLINITGGYDLTLFELDEAANRIRQEVDPDANIIVGSTLDPDIDGVMRVSVVATGIEAEETVRDIPRPVRAADARPLEVAPAAEPVAAQAQPAPQPVAQPTPVARVHDFDERPLAEAPAAAPEAAPANRFEQDGAFIAPAAQSAEEAEAEPAPAAAAPRVAGEPTPETLARLQAAVSHPADPAARRRETPAAQPTPAARPAPAAQPAARQETRFGINSLIHRMTGSGDSSARPASREPSLHGRGDDQAEADRQREIPAFLRRQAN
ncbi:cell division protein FtsZ [Albimonas pacifica]|uniref:Cell division protein FtsZ n=1 Tax=Albimonas pacifica TaxID=1114924 RepID=A0A1I3HQ54_9RHOB|nr:cell division protein FtsZ [Albimonas pacifica]SFI37753.1 cell division protein FtsZ [Albimonas pacifica]